MLITDAYLDLDIINCTYGMSICISYKMLFHSLSDIDKNMIF
jgi:hypothetical protein